MAFKGDLKNVQLADLFQTLAQNRQEGILTLTTRGETHRVWFSHQGVSLLDPAINGRRRLGDILVSAGLVDDKDISEALRDQAKTRRLLGDILVDKGRLKREDLEHILSMQVEEELYELFRSEGGLFEFAEGDPAVRGETPTAPVRAMAVDHVVLEAARRLDEWGIIQKQIPSLESVYVSEVDPTSLGADEEGALVLARLDGRRDVRDAADALLSSPFSIAKILARLVEEGKARPALAEELLESAKALLAEGQRPRALKLLNRLAALAPKLPALDVELADLFRIAGDARAAAQARLRLAALARNEEHLDEARRQLEIALREWPGSSSVLEPLVQVTRALGDTAAELRYVHDLAEVLTEGGAHEGALKAMERVLELAPADAEARRRYSDLCLRARLKEKAIEVLEQDAQRLKREGNLVELGILYKRILAIDGGRKDIKRALAKLRRSRTDKLLRLGLLLTIVLAASGIGGLVTLRHRDRVAGLAAVSHGADLLRDGDPEAAKAAVEQALADYPRPEVVAAAMQVMDQVDERVADSTRMKRGAREEELNGKLAALQAEAVRLSFDTAFAGTLTLLESETEPYLQDRIRARLEMIKQSFLDLVARAKDRAERYREPEKDDDVAAAYQQMSSVFPVELSTALPNVRTTAFEAAKRLKDQPRDWMHQVLAAVDSYELVQARMKPVIEMLRARHLRLATLQQLSSDYLEAVRAAETGNIERSRALLRKVLDEYGQGELKAVFEKRLERLDAAAAIVQDIEQHLAQGDIDTAHATALRAAQEYRDLQIPTTLGVPVSIESLPAGARVVVNDKEVGTTPLLLRLPLGTRAIAHLLLDHCETADLVVDPMDGPRARVELQRKKLVTVALPGSALTKPLWSEGHLFVAGRDGQFHCVDVDAAGKATLRSFRTRSISGSLAEPVAVPGGALFTIFEGEVFRIDATGKELCKSWSRSLEQEIRYAPIVVQDEALVVCGPGRIIALALADGSVRWSVDVGERRITGEPAAVGGILFLPVAGGTLVRIDLATHAIAGEVPAGEDLIGGLTGDEHVLLATSATGRLLLLDPKSGAAKGAVETGDLCIDRPLLHWPHADLSLGKSVLRVDLEHRVVTQTWRSDVAPVAAPLALDGLLWVNGDKGVVCLLDPASQQVVARTKLGAVTLAGSPILMPLGVAILARDGTLSIVAR